MFGLLVGRRDGRRRAEATGGVCVFFGSEGERRETEGDATRARGDAQRGKEID